MKSTVGQAGLVVGGALASTLIIKYAGDGIQFYLSKDKTGKNFNEIILSSIVGAAAYWAFSQKQVDSKLNEGHYLLLGMLGGAVSQLSKSAVSKVSGPPLLQWNDPQIESAQSIRPKATIIY